MQEIKRRNYYLYINIYIYTYGYSYGYISIAKLIVLIMRNVVLTLIH